jgi:hypothetical protein
MVSTSKLEAFLVAGAMAAQPVPAMTHNELINAIVSKSSPICKDGDTRDYTDRLTRELQLAATPALERIFNAANHAVVCLNSAMTNQNTGEWYAKPFYKDVAGGLYKFNHSGENKTMITIPEGSSFTPRVINKFSNILTEFNQSGHAMAFAVDRSFIEDLTVKPSAQQNVNVVSIDGIRTQSLLNPALLNIPSR